MELADRHRAATPRLTQLQTAALMRAELTTRAARAVVLQPTGLWAAVRQEAMRTLQAALR